MPDLFDQVVFFHRPVVATSLFPDDGASVLPVCGPHVVNAALEARLIRLSRVALVKADFQHQVVWICVLVVFLVFLLDFNIPVRGNKGQTVFSES